MQWALRAPTQAPYPVGGHHALYGRSAVPYKHGKPESLAGREVRACPADFLPEALFLKKVVDKWVDGDVLNRVYLVKPLAKGADA